MEEKPIDLAFIGALNVDNLITIGKSKDAFIESILEKYFHRNGERETSKSDIDAALKELQSYPVKQQLSGSSFIALHAAQALGLDLVLACVGVEGATGDQLPSFSDWLDEKRIDRSLVFSNIVQPAATCIALTYQGQRSLATYPGANVDAAHFFSQSYQIMLQFLSRCRRVHTTSFFDDTTPDLLLRLASDLRKHSPLTRISLDPGLRWITTKRDFVLSFMRLADTVFVNPAEFTSLFGQRDSIDEIQSLFQQSHYLRRLVLKRPDATSLFTKIDRGIQRLTVPHDRLRDEEIVDDTGAGDVFAGTLLALEQSDVAITSRVVELAVQFAKKKLGRIGQDFSDFGHTFRQSVRQNDDTFEAAINSSA